MTSKLQDDLNYLRDMAEAGQDAPSLSGRFSLLWFGLLAVALLLHWALAKGLVGGLEERHVGFVWLGFGLLGGLGSFLISRTMRDMPGQSAARNKVDRHTWRITGLGLFLYAITVAFTVALRADIGTWLFDTIMPTAFLAYAISYSATAAFTRGFSKWLPVILSLAFCAITVALIGLTDTYLASAVGVVAIWSVSGFGELRNEPKSVI